MSQPMYDRYSDFEELRPTGEASHSPDTMLDDGCESDLLAATRLDEHWWRL
ncbi:hypothetical protein SAMN05443574_12819 [Haloarcula vallismortis]|uniref:Uncharacterized protein n=2 Tax=Haloarcula vallismortis TaxID=28442 RepID=A0A1H3APR6_HALVA|nr:hypothetical protein SAMN05443574_12819 [Haloarcula vallismortis]